jgi:hypothetical protein
VLLSVLSSLDLNSTKLVYVCVDVETVWPHSFETVDVLLQSNRLRAWRRSTSGRCQLLVLIAVCLSGCYSREVASGPDAPLTTTRGEPLELFRTQPIGATFSSPPKISHVQIVDLNQDNLKDVLLCDCENNQVCWVRQTADGKFIETALVSNVIAPAHAECVDMDGDGDLDVLVAVLGMLFPNNDKIGSVVVLENLGNQGDGSMLPEFRKRVLLQDVARVSDVRAGDMDGDGKIDLVVTQFGYNEGELRWMKNLGDWQFESRILHERAGGIHGVIADMNADQKLDIVLLISQEFEEVLLFLGDGRGGFTEELIYAAGNEDYGSSGMWVEDLDLDGDPDILFTNGDAYDYSPPHPWPWHGVQWLENQGNGSYRYQRLAELGGAVCAQAVDFDADGDVDIFASSVFNAWESPESQSLILLENTGEMRFVQHALANTPTHIQSIALSDLDADGIIDLVSGGMHVSEPYDRVERLLFWKGVRNNFQR